MRTLDSTSRLLAACLAVVVLAGCGAQRSDQESASTPSSTTPTSPAPSDAPAPPSIPADFPLAAGMPGRGDSDVDFRPPAAEDDAFGEVEVCGRGVWPVGTAGDASQLVTSASGPEWFEGRRLTLHADTEVATDALSAIGGAVARCRAHGNQVWTPLESDLGDESVTVGLTYSDGLGSSVLQFTRLGPAVLLVTTSGEGALADLPAQAAEVTGTTQALLGKMCALEGVTCPAEPAPSAMCDPGLGAPVVTDECPEPMTATFVEAGANDLLVQPVRVRWSDEAGAETWAAEHGIEYPFSGGYHQEPQGDPVRVLPSERTTCTWWYVPGGTTGDVEVACPKLVRLLSRSGGTLAVWYDGDAVRQISALYRP